MDRVPRPDNLLTIIKDLQDSIRTLQVNYRELYGLSSGVGFTAGAGLALSGSTLNIGAGNGITVNANDIEIDDSVVVTHSDLGTYATDAELATHEADTTNVHGIVDTAQIAFKNATNTFTQNQTISASILPNRIVLPDATDTTTRGIQIGSAPSIFTPGFNMIASADRFFNVGQATDKSFYFGWRYNATAANAYAEIGTFGNTNPIVFNSPTRFQTSAPTIVRGGAAAGSDALYFAYESTPTQYRHVIKSAHNSGADATNWLSFFIWKMADGANAVASTEVLRLKNTAIEAYMPITQTTANSFLSALSGGAANYGGLAIGRTSAEAFLGMAGVAGHFSTDSVQGDTVLSVTSGTLRLNVGGASASELRIAAGGITAAAPIAMSNNTISGLPASASNGQAVRHEQLTALSSVYQPLDATLTAMAGVTTAANKLIYFTGADTAAATDITSWGRSVLAATYISGSWIPDDTILETHIGDEEITAPLIQANAIGTTHLDALAVTTAKLAAAAVEADKIAAGAVTTTKLNVVLSSSTANVLDNSGAELGTKPWTQTDLTQSVTTTSAQAQSGAKAFRVESLTGGAIQSLGYQNFIAITEGDTYTFSGYVKSDSTTRGFAARIIWYDSTGLVGSTSTGSVATSSSAGWTRYTVTAAAPAGKTQAKVLIQTSTNAGLNEIHYYDSMQFEKAGAASTYSPKPIELGEGAITAETITSGIFTGPIFQTSAADPKVRLDTTGLFSTDASGNKTVELATDGLDLLTTLASSPVPERTIRWKTSTEVLGEIYNVLGGGYSITSLDARKPASDPGVLSMLRASDSSNAMQGGMGVIYHTSAPAVTHRIYYNGMGSYKDLLSYNQTTGIFSSEWVFASGYDGKLRNADVDASAAIAYSKIAMPSFGTRFRNGATFAALINPVADRLYYSAIFVTSDVTLTGIRIRNGATVNGNVRVALFNSAGTRIALSASTAQTGASASQDIPFASTQAVTQGKYYVAAMFSSATATFASGYDLDGAADVSGSMAAPPASVGTSPAGRSDIPLLMTY